MSDAQIFQIISLIYISIGVGILINPAFYKKLYEDFFENSGVLYLGGVAALVIGYLIVAFHNTWTRDLSVIITIFGWMALVKGIIILTLPKIMKALTRAIANNASFLKIQAILVIILGLGLAYLGFCPKSPI